MWICCHVAPELPKMEMLYLKTSSAYILLNICQIWMNLVLIEREFGGESEGMLCGRELGR